MTLQDWKKWKGYNLVEFAKALKMSESFASLLLRGKRGAGRQTALQIEKLTHRQVSKEEVTWPDVYGP